MMKKILILLLMICCITSCSKGSIEEKNYEDSKEEYIAVTLKINMPLNYEDLDNIFIYPMNDYLVENEIGEIIGDGSPIDDYGPYATDIEFDIIESKLNKFKEMILEYRYPKGSYLEINGEKDIEFGDLLGVRIVFNDLNSEKVDNIYLDLEKELDDQYEFKTIYNINDITTAYFYGISIETIKNDINSYIDNNQLNDYVKIVEMSTELE